MPCWPTSETSITAVLTLSVSHQEFSAAPSFSSSMVSPPPSHPVHPPQMCWKDPSKTQFKLLTLPLCKSSQTTCKQTCKLYVNKTLLKKKKKDSLDWFKPLFKDFWGFYFIYQIMSKLQQQTRPFTILVLFLQLHLSPSPTHPLSSSYTGSFPNFWKHHAFSFLCVCYQAILSCPFLPSF